MQTIRLQRCIRPRDFTDTLTMLLNRYKSRATGFLLFHVHCVHLPFQLQFEFVWNVAHIGEILIPVVGVVAEA